MKNNYLCRILSDLSKYLVYSCETTCRKEPAQWTISANSFDLNDLKFTPGEKHRMSKTKVTFDTILSLPSINYMYLTRTTVMPWPCGEMTTRPVKECLHDAIAIPILLSQQIDCMGFNASIQMVRLRQ